MNCQPSFRSHDPGVAVADPDLDGFGWVARELLGEARTTEAATAGPRPRPEPPHRRVPDRDIVYVGPRLSRREEEPLDLAHAAVRRPAAVPAPATTGRSPPRGSLTRPLLALLILELTVLGAMHVGKRYASSQVIVTPAPSSERSVIT